MKLSKIILNFFLVLTLMFILVNCGQEKSETIRIAGNLPLSGPISAWSGQYPNGFNMGIKDACQENGIPEERFVMDFQDNAGKPSQASSIVQKQLLKDVDIYISGTSDMSTAISPEINKLGIPHFLAAFDAYLCKENINKLRILPHFKIEGPLFVKYAKKKNAKRIFIIALNISSIVEEHKKIVEPGLDKEGIEYKEEFFDFNTRDYNTIALKVSEFKPDIIFVSGFSFHIYPILGALRTFDLIKEGSVLCNMDFVDLLHNDTPRSELSEVAFITPIIEMPKAINAFEEWKLLYQKMYNRTPTYVEAYAYETARTIVAAYKKDKNLNKDNIRSILPRQGIIGEINLDADGDLVSTLTIGYISKSHSIEKLDV